MNSIFSICACFRWGMYLQLAILLIGVIMSCRTTNWLGLFCLFRWYVIRTAKTAAARMSIYVSASYTYVFCIWYARIIFPNVWYILYMVVFTCVFPGEAVLVLIPYSCSIKLLLKLWPRNYPPLSYMISTGHGYRTSYVVSANFTIVISFFLLYCVISNHPGWVLSL